jgi:hypothetical protein
MPLPAATYDEQASHADERAHRALARAGYAHGRRQLAVTLPAQEMWRKEAKRHEATAKLEAEKADGYRRQAEEQGTRSD